MTQIARIRDNTSERRLQAERLTGARALQEAQALRFSVFSEEFTPASRVLNKAWISTTTISTARTSGFAT